MKRQLTTLAIYITRHCTTCVEAVRLAEAIRHRFGGINVKVIDLEAADAHNLDDVFTVPTYVLNGKIIALGNPSLRELEHQLLRSLATP